MKIAFLGNFSVDYCSEVHYKKTLEKMGHEVIPLQEGGISSDDILKEAVKADMFFWVHTHGWYTMGIEDTLKELKRLNIPTVGYHLDLWLGIERERDLDTDPYWNIDYFFSVDKLMVDYLNAREDKPKAFYLPAGVFEEECYIGQEREEYKYDVVFVGSKNYHHEWPYRKILIEWLENEYRGRFAQFGNGGKGTIRGNDLNDLYASCKVVVGDTLFKGFNYPYYLSDRIFETTGRGGMIIHPYIKGLDELFDIGYVRHGSYDPDQMEIGVYGFTLFQELKMMIDFFLEHENKRKAVQMRGFERTKKDHTYTQRLTKLLETIENEKNK